MRIGVDFGGVIVRSRPGADTPDPATAWEELPGAVAGVRALVRAAEGQVWIVSRAGPLTEERSLEWMGDTGFFTATALPPEHVRFCRERVEKADHCRELGITHFIDDTAEVIRILHGIVPHLYRMASPADAGETPEFATRVDSWSELMRQNWK